MHDVYPCTVINEKLRKQSVKKFIASNSEGQLVKLTDSEG